MPARLTEPITATAVSSVPAMPAEPTGALASPAGDYLRDPWGAFHHVLSSLRDLAVTWGPVAGPALVLVVTAVVVTRWRWRRRYNNKLATDARLVTVLAPPTVDPAGAITVWSNLVGLLRPGWLRRFGGQPHVTFEFVFTGDGVQIRLWVPGPVPPGMVERAIEAAWPGAHTRTTAAKPPLPTKAPDGRRIEVVGGELRLARSEALPIRIDHPADPIRALLGAPVGLGPQERACVQILARPVAGYRVTKARPRTDDILRSGLLTLTALPGTPTLVDLPKLLTVPAFRQRACSPINDDVLRGFWSWYDDLSEASRAQVIAPLMNKVRGFLLRPFVRAAIAGGQSTVDMDAILDSGGICLVRIARDALGMETARLVGSIVVARTWQAATRRARIPQRQRRDAGLYIDECHNFLNLAYPLEDMLAEARGYRLSVTLAHQYLGQLPKELEEGVSTNARSKIFFNASPEDAKRLARHTLPRLSDHDLSNLGAYHIAARLVLNREEARPFTAVTEKLPPPIPGRAKAIRKAAKVNACSPIAVRNLANRASPPAVDPRRAA